ncbi:MAG: hypothetical protein KZQ83_09910 [gamma proteobacterium symbiont of Taylorina sp.]|nr:hypothetical protein [gamma proteobacterium symbiont of Taylorina sp.]
MELQILADQFIIKYSPIWMFLLLLSGLIFFFLSKLWHKRLKEKNQFDYKPSVLFIVSFIFLMGGIHFFVYKIVLNKDMIILFNIHDFNRQLEWVNIDHVEYQDKNQVIVYMKQLETEQKQETVLIDLHEMEQEDIRKVKILIDYKLRTNHR